MKPECFRVSDLHCAYIHGDPLGAESFYCQELATNGGRGFCAEHYGVVYKETAPVKYTNSFIEWSAHAV